MSAVENVSDAEVASVTQLMERARSAMLQFAAADQTRVDEVVTAIAWSLYKPENAQRLAELAVLDTGIGNVADKIIKNQRKTFGTLRDLMRARTVGIIEDQPEREEHQQHPPPATQVSPAPTGSVGRRIDTPDTSIIVVPS